MSLPSAPPVVAINHTAPSLDYLLHVIKYDSTHGTCKHAADLSIDEEHQALVFRGRRITLFSERDLTKLDWSSAGAEYVIESTGKFLTQETASLHVTAGKAKKVVLSAPAKDPNVPTIVVGVNRKTYRSDMQVVSNASCTVSLASAVPAVARRVGRSRRMLTRYAPFPNRPTASHLSPKFWSNRSESSTA